MEDRMVVTSRSYDAIVMLRGRLGLVTAPTIRLGGLSAMLLHGDIAETLDKVKEVCQASESGMVFEYLTEHGIERGEYNYKGELVGAASADRFFINFFKDDLDTFIKKGILWVD